jgi:hypothetical protein
MCGCLREFGCRVYRTGCREERADARCAKRGVAVPGTNGSRVTQTRASQAQDTVADAIFAYWLEL